MDDVADLVVTPFRDIVEKGRAAVENAGDTRPMLKAAQALVKEGERALKRIEPLCRKHLDEYGPNFLDALKENDDIANFRSELNDLLWEFDDYIDPDEFDADKFAELQGLSRKAAPKIYDILMRMKLEVPVDHDARSIMTRMSAPRSPPISPSPPPVLPLFPNSSTAATTPIDPPAHLSGSLPGGRSPEPTTVEAATDQLKRMMQTQSGPDQGLYGGFPPPVPPPRQPLPPIEPPPRPPSANPWDVKTPPPIPESRMRDDFTFDRRAPVAPIDSPPMDPISPPISPETRPKAIPMARPRPLNTGADRSSQISNDPRLSPTGFDSTYERNYNPFPSQSPRGRYSSATYIMSTSIPEDAVSDRDNHGGRLSHPIGRLPPLPDYRAPPSRPESLESNISSVFDSNRRNDGSTTPLTSEHRGSTVSGLQNSPTLGTSLPAPIYVKPLPVPPAKHVGRQLKTSAPPLPAPPPIDENPIPVQTEFTPIMSDIDVDTGLIPVATEKPEPAYRPNPYAIDCKITPDSSFYVHKGFCEGAQDVIRGGVGVKKTKKAGFTSTATIGRCIKCFFELDFKEIELDINGADRGNFIKNGIGFRLRFLQKSHLPTRRSDDILYGCLFCIHTSKTLHASDATVFTSQKSLFAHLARHPQPLPNVPGVTVIERDDIPPQFHNNYDLHLKKPHESHPVIEKADDIALLPTGTSREAARRMYGQRLLFDKTPALEMVQGAKIVGLHWPERYIGEWAMGWHDGVFASLPMEILKLDQPPDDELQLCGTSQTQVTTKWKFNPKDRKGTKWLKFDKEEVLGNISWAYRDHWCWSGTNAKGQWGIFPMAFVDASTLRDSGSILSDRASVLSEEKKSGSMLARFGTRRSNRSGGRPASVAGSTGSGETPPTPSMY